MARAHGQEGYLGLQSYMYASPLGDKDHLWYVQGETLDELVQGRLGAPVGGGHVEVGLTWQVLGYAAKERRDCQHSWSGGFSQQR